MSKWPFYLGDLLLVIVAVVVVNQAGEAGLAPLIVTAACVAIGAWLCVTPYLMEYRAVVNLAEVDTLGSTMAQIQQLEQVAERIGQASGHWQSAQEQSAKTVQTAREVSERISLEAKGFAEFLKKANDGERATLRLEIDKLRRGEAEWLQIAVHLLDHVYALYSAAARSGQRGLIEQLAGFQNACRDVVRRVGLIPFQAGPDDMFDPNAHQTAPEAGEPAPGARIAETIATGYTFQGQLVRRALVRLDTGAAQPDPISAPAPAGSPASSNVSEAKPATSPTERSPKSPVADAQKTLL